MPLSEPVDVRPDRSVEPAVAAAEAAEQLTRDIDAAVRRAQTENLIKGHVLAAAAASLVPVALLDIAALVAGQIVMARRLARYYGVPFDELRARVTVMSLLAGSLPTLSVMALSSGAKLIAGIGTLVGSGSVAVAGGAATYAVGKVLVHHFEHGGTLLSLDARQQRLRFRRELRRGWGVAAQAARSDRRRASPDGVHTAR
jgi:uncharacterized protein (DUF697 family)